MTPIPIEHQIAVLEANGWKQINHGTVLATGVYPGTDDYAVCPEPSFDLLHGALDALKREDQANYAVLLADSIPVSFLMIPYGAAKLLTAALPQCYAAFFKAKGGK